MHYRIVEWDKYQHYKERDPPWIKLHRDLLTSQTWVMLSDASRVLAIACMLVAAGTGNRIPTDPEYLRRRAYLHKEPDFKPLADIGFIELVNEDNTVADASKAEQMLAIDTKCSPEKRRGETEKSRSASKGSRLPEDWKPTQEEIRYAADQGCTDPSDTAERFKLHHLSKGTVAKNWRAGFQYWCRNEKNFKRAELHKANGYAKPDSPPPDPWEQRIRGWVAKGQWLPNLWGPAPGQAGCRAPLPLIPMIRDELRALAPKE